MAAKYLDRNQIEAEYNIPRATLETQATRGGGIPFSKVGRRCLYSREDVERYLTERRVRHTSEYGRLPRAKAE